MWTWIARIAVIIGVAGLILGYLVLRPTRGLLGTPPLLPLWAGLLVISAVVVLVFILAGVMDSRAQRGRTPPGDDPDQPRPGRPGEE